MININRPVTYHRNFRNDLPAQTTPPPGDTRGEIQEKCRQAALAILPLISLCRPFRRLLTVGMSGARSMTHMSKVAEHLQKGDLKESSYHMLQTSLSTASIGLFFFNPVFSLLASSSGDAIANMRQLVESARAGNAKATAESLAHLALDGLFIASFCYGAIEITVACMLLQTATAVYQASGHLRKGEYLEAACQGLFAGANLYRSVPQLKLLKWKWDNQPVCMAELKRNKEGGVYLEIPEEHLRSLLNSCSDGFAKEPWYFRKGERGGHVSVILNEELWGKEGLTVDDVGKKFSFRLVQNEVVSQRVSDKDVGVGWYESFGENRLEKHVVTIASPELEALRKRHGFSSRIPNQQDSFHITYGWDYEYAAWELPRFLDPLTFLFRVTR